MRCNHNHRKFGLTAAGRIPILKNMLKHSDPLSLAFQALADPTRRALVDHLVGGPASVTQLSEPLAMTMSAVVQHLGVLEAAGLVRSE